MDTVLPALRNILCYLFLGVQHGSEQSRHVLPGMVAFEPGGLVRYHRIGNGMSLVEGVVGEIVNLVVDGLSHILGNTSGGAPGNLPVRVAVKERLPLPFDVLDLLFAHGSAHHVCLSQRIARQLPEDLDHLLLVDDTAIGNGQNRLQQRMFVADQLWIVLAGNKARDGVHRAWAVQGNDGGDVLDILGLQPNTYSGHPRRLHLEHARRPPVRQHLKYLRVVLWNLI